MQNPNNQYQQSYPQQGYGQGQAPQAWQGQFQGEQQYNNGFQAPPQMNGSSPYAPNAAPPQNKLEAEGFRTDKLNPKPKWNDLIFAILFYAQFGAFIAVSVIALRALAQTGGQRSGGLGDTGSSITIDRSVAYLFALIAAAALVLSIIFLMIVRAFTKVIIEVC